MSDKTIFEKYNIYILNDNQQNILKNELKQIQDPIYINKIYKQLNNIKNVLLPNIFIYDKIKYTFLQDLNNDIEKYNYNKFIDEIINICKSKLHGKGLNNNNFIQYIEFTNIYEKNNKYILTNIDKYNFVLNFIDKINTNNKIDNLYNYFCYINNIINNVNENIQQYIYNYIENVTELNQYSQNINNNNYNFILLINELYINYINSKNIIIQPPTNIFINTNINYKFNKNINNIFDYIFNINIYVEDKYKQNDKNELIQIKNYFKTNKFNCNYDFINNIVKRCEKYLNNINQN